MPEAIKEVHPLHDSYPSVVNLNNPDQIKIFIAEFPELLECDWVLQEKYHGFNFQVTYLPNVCANSCYEPDYAGSREIQVNRETEFYGAWAAIDAHKDDFAKLRHAANFSLQKITVYMEIFGGKVSHGIKYDIKQGTYRLKFLDVKVDGKMLSPAAFYQFIDMFNIDSSLAAKPLAIVKGIHAAVEYNPIFHSNAAISGDGSENDRSFAEGFVAKPFNKHFKNKGGKNILIKKKNPRFEEFALEKIVRVINPEVTALREIFKGFLNENRIESAFSKLGPITGKQQIDMYLKHIMGDARLDFEAQYAEELCSLLGDDKKSVFNVGSFLALQLLERIQNIA